MNASDRQPDRQPSAGAIHQPPALSACTHTGTSAEAERPKDVAVVILNWNGARLLEQYLPSVVAHTPTAIAEVVVADNGSTDGSLRLLAERFPRVRVIRFEENHGFAEGYNRALRMIESPYTVLLNSDVEVTDDWLTPLHSFMESHPAYGACQPMIQAAADHRMFEYAGAAGGYLDRNGFPYCRGRIFAYVEENTGQYADQPFHDIFWASGAAMMVRTELYNRLGGLDPRFFAHMEEIDLCWRIQLEGKKLAAVTGATVYHLGGGSLPAGNPRKTYLNFRNNLLMLHKNLPDNVRGPMLLKRRLLDTLAWARFVATLDFANAGAILRAHRDFRRMRAPYTAHPDRNILTETPEGRRNILTEYYLRGHRRFSDLGN